LTLILFKDKRKPKSRIDSGSTRSKTRLNAAEGAAKRARRQENCASQRESCSEWIHGDASRLA
jgi:hypothetical protein